MNKTAHKEILKIAFIASLPLMFIIPMDKTWQSAAGTLGIFLFTYIRGVISHFQRVNNVSPKHAYNNVSDDDSSWTHTPHTAQNMINPSTGLPMIGGIGGTDLHGNSFGSTLSESSSWTSSSHDSQTLINPASSLPMMGGIGGTDLHGNTYGSNTNNW